MANWGGSDEEIDLDNHDDDDDEGSDGEDVDDDVNDDLGMNDEEEEEEINYEIMQKFMRTFSNGDYDVEFDDALSSHQSATVPDTRTTQASYNKPDNWRERNRIGLEKVIQRLQSCIDSVTRDNSFYLELTHNGYGHQLMDNEEPIV